MPSRRKDCRDHPRKLLVEGETDKCVIPYLMEENGVAWPDVQGEYPVCIEAYGGLDEILKPEVIDSELAASGLEALGVVVDANGDAAARWGRVKTWCAAATFADLPDQIPAEGLEVVHSSGPRFGVWICRRSEAQPRPVHRCSRKEGRDSHVARLAEPAGSATARSGGAYGSGPCQTGIPTVR